MPRSHHARSPRSPATSPAQYPAGSGVGVSVLLKQPEGFGLGREPLEANHSVAKPEHVGLGKLGWDITSAPGCENPSLDQDRVAEVRELLRLPADLREHVLCLAKKLLRFCGPTVDPRVRQLAALVQF